jgi:hypothetical protein
MQLELKRISYNARLSQETNAYSADLYMDGRKVATCSNAGHGGCDEVHWLVPEAADLIDAFFKTVPPIKSHGYELQPDLELWCGQQVDRFATLKNLRRVLGRCVVLIDAQGVERNFPKLKPVRLAEPNVQAELAKRYPGATILNGLDDGALMAAVDRMEAAEGVGA